MSLHVNEYMQMNSVNDLEAEFYREDGPPHPMQVMGRQHQHRPPTAAFRAAFWAVVPYIVPYVAPAWFGTWYWRYFALRGGLAFYRWANETYLQYYNYCHARNAAIARTAFPGIL